jgi:hypothetical protein
MLSQLVEVVRKPEYLGDGTVADVGVAHRHDRHPAGGVPLLDSAAGETPAAYP